MRTEVSFLLIALGQLCAVVMAQEQPAAVISRSSTERPIYVTHVTVIDTETGKESQDRTVVISGDRISEVRDSKGVKPPPDAKVVDGTGKYLIPGLWDMHVHSWNYEATFPIYIANGVTGVRDMSGPQDANKFRAELATKKGVTPHFYLASPIIDGHPKMWPTSIEVSTPEQARKVVDEQHERGADFIKVYSRLSRESYFAIIDESKHLNIPVEGHVPNQIGAWEASEAKQKSIEHLHGIPDACSDREEEMQPKIIAAPSFKERLRLHAEASRSHSEKKCQRLFVQFVKNNTWQVPTLTLNRAFGMLNDPQFTHDDRVRYFGGELRDGLTAKNDFRFTTWTAADFAAQRELYAYDQKVVGAMFRAGVPMLAGTDTGNPYCFPGFSLHDELALLVESGVSPLGALQAATRNAALFMDASDKYGSVSPGKVADLVLLKADPLQDVHNTTKISAVFLAGKEFDRAALDSMLRGAETAAKEESERSSTEAELRAVMAELHRAALEGDTEKTTSLMTDEYVQTDSSGHF
jgi:imidazolonepropionase-like amidohydrolase